MICAEKRGNGGWAKLVRGTNCETGHQLDFTSVLLSAREGYGSQQTCVKLSGAKCWALLQESGKPVGSKRRAKAGSIKSISLPKRMGKRGPARDEGGETPRQGSAYLRSRR